MSDSECVAFLQWALPRLGLRWPGFRRVRGQVRKRLARRLHALGLADLQAYRRRLEGGDAAEWQELEAMCRIAISRFWRDRRVWERLADEVVPALAREALARDAPLTCWSAGCASGEEPYTLALVWDRRLAPALPGLRLRVLATDADEAVLERARRACYGPSSVRELPAGWVDACFTSVRVDDGASGREDVVCLAPRLRARVELRRADLRGELLPDGWAEEVFDLVLCRNLAFTYFDEAAQRTTLTRLVERLRPGGVLVIGRKERLPDAGAALAPIGEATFRRVGASRQP